jgi:hypothetical protein
MAIINGVGRVGIRNYVAPTSLSSIITNGLLLSIDAGNTSSYTGTGTTWTDLSGNGNNGTLVNGTSYSSENGGVMVFDGVNDYVSRDNFIGNATTFTVCHWINLSSNQTTRTIFSNYTGSGWVTGISDSSANVIKFYLGGGHLYATYPLEINKWYYVCVTYNNGNPTIYINGVLNSTTTGNINFGSLATNNDIGRLGDGRQYFNGKISNLQTYNRALSASEILQNFDGTKTRFGYVSYATRTAAFASATGITDATILNALNTFEAGLISNGLDTKMKALYPFVGGTANTHKFNFMDARDLNTAFRLQFNGGWVHSNNGIQGNGTNTYANTYFNQFINFTDWHKSGIGIYSRTNETGVYLEGNSGFLGSNFNLYPKYPSLGALHETGNTYVGGVTSDSFGLIIGSSISVSDRRIYKNGTKLATGTGTNIDVISSGINVYFGALNYRSNSPDFIGNKQYAMALLTEGMTDTDQTNLYTLVQALQTSLGRQV